MTTASSRCRELSAQAGVAARARLFRRGVEVEVWALSPEAFGRFVQKIPAPLGIGKVSLDDGTAVSGFCEAHAAADALEITDFGGWRHYVRAKTETTS